ncbi:hypothetical protein [Streptomyces sp. MK7]|uniref:hypothetical protein n=1 Tax=Streptomyces sp. MK7 TaxID=3067635 RepID=UPI00292F27C5|nr:hypothetical protein [Streptomyces sp. MK7]
MTHLRTTVWGPAEFTGFPPRRLVVHGMVTGLLGVTAILGTALVGAWTGLSALADGAGGLACAAALVLYLWWVGAGRALVGAVAVLGVFLALQAPQAAAGVVLAERGRVQPVVVTAVQEGRAPGRESDRYVCSVTDAHGVPLKVRIWRGCGDATRPGDALAVVYDPRGTVPPRGLEPGAGGIGALRDLVSWAAVLGAGCAITVIRSYRLSGQPWAVPGAEQSDGLRRPAGRRVRTCRTAGVSRRRRFTRR